MSVDSTHDDGEETMAAKKRLVRRSGTQILFDRLYRGKPQRVAELKRTREELALGRKIRGLREGRGLSQTQLAKALGTQAPAISRLEDADYDGHSLRILRKVADYFGQNLVVSFEPKRPGEAAVKKMEKELVRA
jgi:DNA-binding XRE family transcriptional regulator